jgi:hypothetical protein
MMTRLATVAAWTSPAMAFCHPTELKLVEPSDLQAMELFDDLD